MSNIPVPFPLWYVASPVGRWLGDLAYPGPGGPPASPLFSTPRGAHVFLNARPAYDYYDALYIEHAADLLDHLDALTKVRVMRMVLDPESAGERWFDVAELRDAVTMGRARHGQAVREGEAS